MHTVYGALPVPFVPVCVTRGALVVHWYSYAPPRCRTSQYPRTFCTSLSISMERYCWQRVRWCGTNGFYKQLGLALLILLSWAAISHFVFWCFLLKNNEQFKINFCNYFSLNVVWNYNNMSPPVKFTYPKSYWTDSWAKVIYHLHINDDCYLEALHCTQSWITGPQREVGHEYFISCLMANLNLMQISSKPKFTFVK